MVGKNISVTFQFSFTQIFIIRLSYFYQDYRLYSNIRIKILKLEHVLIYFILYQTFLPLTVGLNYLTTDLSFDSILYLLCFPPSAVEVLHI